MKLTEMFPSNLLKAQDVTDAGGLMELTIYSVEIKEFDGDNGKEKKPIVVFSNEKRMVLNKTNANRLVEMFGDDTDMWLNKKITLQVEETDFQGKSVPSVRVKKVGGKDAIIQAYWDKARNVMGLTAEEGQAHLKKFNGDFAAALAAFEGNPFA